MNNINVGRVLLGGLLAGLVMNIGEFLLNAVVLAEPMKEEFRRLNLPPEPSGRTIAIWVVLTFILGIAIVYLYALIRPRLGVGVKTAICAGSLAWFFVSLYVGLSFLAMGLFSTGLTVTGMVWAFFEYTIAAVAGAWLYKEA
ncbi:MAG: hypothetical protein L0226_06930 [Acidobacteria bacterium]|nr:hypothetical protein [Acidobacteriota bacterium]